MDICDFCLQEISIGDDERVHCGCEEECPCGCEGDESHCVYSAQQTVAADSSICPSCGHIDGYHPPECMAGEQPLNRTVMPHRANDVGEERKIS